MRTPLAIIAVLALSIVRSPLALAAAPDEPIACKKLVVRTNKLGSSSGTIDFLCKPTGSDFVLPAGMADPTQSFGMTLFIRDLGSSLYIAPAWGLEAAFWTALGTPPGSKGFRYVNKIPNAPCRSLLVTPKQIKGTKCRAEMGLGTLPVVGDVLLNLYFHGTDSQTYCAQLGGTDVRNDIGALIRKNSPAPVTCPPLF